MEVLSDLGDAARFVARDLRLPFPLYSVGPANDALRVTVPVLEVAGARAFFDQLALRLADGTSVTVEVAGQLGGSWTTYPTTGPMQQPGALEVAGVRVGLAVQEAALRANSAGWIVRACEPEAALTMELRMNRVTLTYDPDGTVTALHVG